jgi:hypothetical protein
MRNINTARKMQRYGSKSSWHEYYCNLNAQTLPHILVMLPDAANKHKRLLVQEIKLLLNIPPSSTADITK